MLHLRCLLPFATSFLLLLPFTTAKTQDMGRFQPECLSEQPPLYSNASSEQVPWYTIDMDLPAIQRWTVVAHKYSEKINATINTVKTLLNVVGDGILIELLSELMRHAPARLPQPYRDELHALALLTGIPIEELALLNLFYEVQKGCTSIVAENYRGQITHARNLDFGTLFLWNATLQDWQLTQNLRDLVINLKFVKGGKTRFKGVTFAGHLGLLTGVKEGAFSISTNTRFGNTFHNLYSFFTQGLMGRQFVIYANRDILMKARNYQEAFDMVSDVRLLANGYFILGGVRPGEGAVITRGFNQVDHVEELDPWSPNGWYVLETNYDWDKPTLFLDNRREPAKECLQKIGRERADSAGLYQVLSSKPVLNKATVHTSIMRAETGLLETFIRTCPNPCWFV